MARAKEMLAAIPGAGDAAASSTTRPTPTIHDRTTAEEIWKDTDGEVDFIVGALARAAH